MIRFQGVTKLYPGRKALDDVSFTISPGDFIFLTGPSGAGKTTLLKMIFRADTPSEGQVIVRGRNVASLPPRKVPFLRRSIGVVFQEFRLIPRKTIFENVDYLPRILGLSLPQRKRVAFETLKRVGLAHRMADFPRQLSGGEQQRLAIARALMNDPEILIADEPTGNLDPALSTEIFQLFREINLRGTTVMIATHDPEAMRRISARIIHLENGKLISDHRQTLPGGDEDLEGNPE